MSEALCHAAQFVHAEPKEILGCLEYLYERGDAKSPVQAHSAVSRHLMQAFNDGFLENRIYSPIHTAAYVGYSIGRTCLVCHQIEKSGSINYTPHLSNTLLPISTLYIGSMPAPNPLCKGCTSAISNRKHKGMDVPVGGLESVEMFAKILISDSFRLRCEQGKKNKHSHRFELTRRAA